MKAVVILKVVVEVPENCIILSGLEGVEVLDYKKSEDVVKVACEKVKEYDDYIVTIPPKEDLDKDIVDYIG